MTQALGPNQSHTPGPWVWLGEDYRADWGWQMLVGPNGEGLIVGAESVSQPSRHICGYRAVDPSLCKTGIAAEGKERVASVHVFSQANARLIAAAPELLEACIKALDHLDYKHVPDDVWFAVNEAIAKATGKAVQP